MNTREIAPGALEVTTPPGALQGPNGSIDAGYELAPTQAAASAQYEIQSAIAIARRFPRSEDQAFARLMHSCKRTSFAEDSAYSFPRGGATVSGPSVNIAREAARVWGNIRYGLEIVHESEDTRQIRGWAWDLESNTKTTQEDEFKKLIFRKAQGWIKPDERDLRELTNRRGSILIRNCLLQLLPKDLIEDALAEAERTMKAAAGADPDAARKKLILAFGELGVTPKMLESHLGHPLGQSSPEEIAKLRKAYTSIRDGNSTWAEYAGPAEPDQSQVERLAGRRKKKEPEPSLPPDMADLKLPNPDDPVRRRLISRIEEVVPQNKAAGIEALKRYLEEVYPGAVLTDLNNDALAKVRLWAEIMEKDEYGPEPEP